MNQRELAKKIGVHERTIRKWSPVKREQWLALASNQVTKYDAAYFDLLNQLVFKSIALTCSGGKCIASVNAGVGACFYISERYADGTLIAFYMLTLYTADDIATALTELEKYA